jgi:hypothetical protein
MMKILLTILTLGFLLAGNLTGQEKTDSSATGTLRPHGGGAERVPDQNANGVDDRLEGKKKAGGKIGAKGRDRFIDANGDGICDGRETGLGFRGGSGSGTGPAGGKGPGRRGGRR